MGGKRKNADEGGELDASGSEDFPEQQGRVSLGGSENGSPGVRSSGRQRKVVKAYDPSIPYNSPASEKKQAAAPAAKKFEPTVSTYIPNEEKEQFGQFMLQVENEWRDVKGFRVFEFKGGWTDMADGKAQFGRLREWYCSKQLEPPGGFLPGHQGFCPAIATWSSLKFDTNSFVEVEIVHKIKDWGSYTRKFIEIVDEQEKVAEAYAKLPPDTSVKVDGEEGAAKAEGGEGEGEGGEGEYAEDDEEEEDGDDDGADGDPDVGLDDGEEEEDDDDDDDLDDEDCRPAQRKPHSRRAVPPADALAAAAAGSRKPQSAYMLFVNARRAELMLEHPGIKMPEVGRRCGEMWRSMGLEQRAEYQAQSAALRKAYRQGAQERERRAAAAESWPAAKGGKIRPRGGKGTAGDPAAATSGLAGQFGVEGGGGEAHGAGHDLAGNDLHRHAGEVGGDGGWAPGLLHDGSEAAAPTAGDAGGFGGPAQAAGGAAGDTSLGGGGGNLEEGRPGGGASFEASATSAAEDGGGGGGGGLVDMLCDAELGRTDESGVGLGVDGDSVGGLGDDGGGLDDGLGGL